MEAKVAAAKIKKYATSKSGDTLELVERPGGGLSFVLVDGQRSGKSAKAIANLVAHKAISLLAEGIRDGAAARAASDYLYTYRAGKVLATLNILSIDLQSQTLVIVRNSHLPVLLIHEGRLQALDEPAEPVGIRREIRPAIREIPLSVGLTAIAYTDGLTYAGERSGKRMDVLGCVESLMKGGPPGPDYWANHLLNTAVALDEGRPADDITVLVVTIMPHKGDEVRHLTVSMPL
jgi:serine phosphatase RsbU (regulator of sigma subunit)